jgi:hypothetical protein
MSQHNKIINLLTGGNTTPVGWGFPPQARTPRAGCQLRDILMFLTDEDGNAQLIRYYHGIIRANHWAYRNLKGGEEGYSPSMFFKPCIESESLIMRRSTITGSLELKWQPGPDVSSVTGYLTLANESSSLQLGGITYSVQLQQREDMDLCELVLPAFLGAVVAIDTPTLPSSHPIIFRPSGFHEEAIVRHITEKGIQDLDQSGLLGTFLSLHRPEDKIAVAWVAVSTIESAS